MDWRVGKIISLVRVRRTGIDEAGLLTEAASDLNLSPSRLRHIFRKELGLSVGQFIRHSRLELAREILETSNLTIKQIVAGAGFNDRRDFTREFKRVFGMSPSAYRRQFLATKFFQEDKPYAASNRPKRTASSRAANFDRSQIYPQIATLTTK
jgi:AraC-like DNA-binding protein